MYFCDAANRPSKELSPGVWTRTFWQNNMLVSLLEFSANAIVPLHTHSEEQVGIVLEGELHMTIGGETRLMKPGEAYVIPSNVEHGGRAGEMPVRVFDAFSPIRKEYRY